MAAPGPTMKCQMTVKSGNGDRIVGPPFAERAKSEVWRITRAHPIVMRGASTVLFEMIDVTRSILIIYV